MRAWESAAWARGATPECVIRSVGVELAQNILELTRAGDSILLLAGRGNNGADGRAALPWLNERNCQLLEVTDPRSFVTELKAALSRPPRLVVDALFGIGLSRELSPEWCELITLVNASRCPVLAVDVPSGLNADTGQPNPTAIRAAQTFTIGAPKSGLLKAPEFVGRLIVSPEVGLGIPTAAKELEWLTSDDFSGFATPRNVSAHKGTYGHVGIIAGSEGYHGAAVLAARGAARAQPGLVTVFTQSACYGPVASQLQAAMVKVLDPAKFPTERLTSLVIGPGLADPKLSPEVRQLVQTLWQTFPGALILDASALEWITTIAGKLPGIRVITPHPGEAARLLGITTSEIQADRLAALRRLAAKFNDPLVVLKGHQTLIGSSTGLVAVNSTGNPHLAQGGSGDLLAGFLGGLMAAPANQLRTTQTVRYGVFEHGAAADRLQKHRHNWTMEELALELGSD
jgi:NAD(P)H-hydrate epimerase